MALDYAINETKSAPGITWCMFVLMGWVAVACNPGSTGPEAKTDSSDGDADADSDSDSDSDGDSDIHSDGDSDGDADGDSDGDADGDSDGDADGDSDGDADGDADNDADNDGDNDGDNDSDNDDREPCPASWEGGRDCLSADEIYKCTGGYWVLEKTCPSGKSCFGENPPDGAVFCSTSQDFLDADADSDSDSDGDSDGDSDSDSDGDSDSDSDSATGSDSDSETDSAAADTADTVPEECMSVSTDATTACTDWLACCAFGDNVGYEALYSSDAESCTLIGKVDEYDMVDEHETNCRTSVRVVRCENIGGDDAQCTCEIAPRNCVPTTDNPEDACSPIAGCCPYFSSWNDDDQEYGAYSQDSDDASRCSWDGWAASDDYLSINCAGLGTADASCSCLRSFECD